MKLDHQNLGILRSHKRNMFFLQRGSGGAQETRTARESMQKHWWGVFRQCVVIFHAISVGGLIASASRSTPALNYHKIMSIIPVLFRIAIPYSYYVQ